MSKNTILIDKGRLFGKVVYIYHCFYSMAVAERLSAGLIFGAALYISLSAIYRIFGFAIKTPNDPRWLKALKLALVVFFTIAAALMLLVFPIVNPHKNDMVTIALIALPFVGRAAEYLWMRRRAQVGPLPRRTLVKTLLVVRTGLLTAALILVAFTGDYILLLAAAMGMAFDFFRQYTFAEYATEYPKPDLASADAHQVRSVRLYDGMVMTSGAALNIFAFTYVLFILFSREKNFFLDFFVAFGAIALMFSIVYLGVHRFFKASLMQRIGLNAAYVMGTCIAIFAVYVFRDSWFTGGLNISLQTILLLVGLTLQMTATLGLREDMRLVIRLYNPKADNAALNQRSTRLELWVSVISETVFLMVLLALMLDPLISDVNLRSYMPLAPQIGSSVAVIPTILLLISFIYSIKQPLTKKINMRLKEYSLLRGQGGRNPEMEKRLYSVLIRKYKKRIGVHIIRAFLKPVMYHSVSGRENVTELPGIFVFNHREVYGPIAAVVFLPFDLRPWILDKMIDKKAVTQHMYNGTFSRIKWLPVFMRKLIARGLSPIVVWALSSFEPIPVYRGTARDVIKTFSLSVECLCAGDSILLFPENPQERYSETEGISDFYRGFANLGRLYYKKSKQSVTFYPVYASRRSRELRIGEGVKYEPEGGRQEEGRIVEALQQRMRTLQQMDDRQR